MFLVKSNEYKGKSELFQECKHLSYQSWLT